MLPFALALIKKLLSFWPIGKKLPFATVLPQIFGLFEYSNNWARIVVFVFAEFSNSEYYSNIWIIDPNTANNLLVNLH